MSKSEAELLNQLARLKLSNCFNTDSSNSLESTESYSKNENQNKIKKQPNTSTRKPACCSYCSAFSWAVPVTSSRLQAMNWTLSTLLVFPVYIPTSSLDEPSAAVPPWEFQMSHTLTELSIDEDATRLLSGLKDKLVTLSV